MSWNIRGFSSPGKIQFLLDKFRRYNREIVILQEMKVPTGKVQENSQRCWRNNKVMTFEATESAGGLEILWDPWRVILKDWMRIKFMLSALIRLIGEYRWRSLTMVYGPPTPHDKATFFMHLKHLSRSWAHQDWILGGDFNLICNLEENRGGGLASWPSLACLKWNYRGSPPHGCHPPPRSTHLEQLLGGRAPNHLQVGWPFLSQDIWELVEESWKLRQLWSGLNATFIALIPKFQEATRLGKFRHISLYNVIYSILSTIMVCKLKLLLHCIIIYEYSGFVEGHQILDGIFSTHETIHSIKSHKLRGMLLKLDLRRHMTALVGSIFWKSRGLLVLQLIGFNG